MFGYIYKTTNLMNSKIYIGKHKWNKQTIDESYLGSGTHLNRAIQKYGRKNFKCEILDYADNLQELNEKEKLYIKEHDALNPLVGYNLTKGGDGTYLPGRFLGDSQNPVVRKKISETVSSLWKDPNSIYNSQSYRDKLAMACSNSHKNNKRDYVYKKISNTKLGHEVSLETRLKISNKLKEDSTVNLNARKINSEKHKNKVWINNGIEQLLIKSELALPYLEIGWQRGRLPYSSETLENMKKGNKASALRRKQKGKIIGIHKDDKNKYIPEPELQLWLDKGYEIGCCKRKIKHTGVEIE